MVSGARELRLRLLADGLEIRDLLDAQGIAYWLTQGAPADWSDEDKRAFALFREGNEAEREPDRPPSPPGEIALPAATAELAAKTHLPPEWLQDKIDLLGRRSRSSSTARRAPARPTSPALAEHLTPDGGDVRLVQFHPAYTYEDFFEGYRPGRRRDGADSSFELGRSAARASPRRPASIPSTPFVLIIDEINRGNLPRSSASCYFLLEYRDQAIEPAVLAATSRSRCRRTCSSSAR